MLREKLDNVVSFHVSMFHEIDLMNQERLVLFTQEELESIRARITHFQQSKANGVNARKGTDTSLIGGSALLKELEKIELAKDSLNKWIHNIREILSPKEVSRTTIADAKEQANKDAIIRLANQYTPMAEKQLKALADVLLGDASLDYLVEELPLVIATKQITGVLLEAGKVLDHAL